MYKLNKVTEPLLRMTVTKKSGSYLLTGEPGTGKTMFTEVASEKVGAAYAYYQCHNWSDSEDLFFRVNVGAVAAGVSDPSDAYTEGILYRAAKASLQGAVVVCIDEIDKAPERFEVLLLDFLQNGRVPTPDGGFITADLKNVLFFATSNGMRDLMPATRRRLFEAKFEYLSADVEAEVIRARTGLQVKACKFIATTCETLRASKDGYKPSLQEEIGLAQDLKDCAQNVGDVKFMLAGYLKVTANLDKMAITLNGLLR